MTVNVNLEIDYTDLDIDYSITKSKPASPENTLGPEVHIRSIKYNGLDLFGLLSEEDMEKINNRLLQDNED